MTAIRLGLIGCGKMGDTHAGRLDVPGSRATVAATADIILERARRTADALGAELAVADYHEMLAAVDAVLIETDGLSPEEVVARLVELVEARRPRESAS